MSDPDPIGDDLTVPGTGDGDPAPAPGGGTEDGRGSPGPDEAELLAAFDRLRPQGSLQWGFDDAMRRIARPETGSTVAPWDGLPDDLWERGRSALIGRRFAGDVTRVLADLLAADARTAAAAAAAGVNVATWDALRYLAARVDRLEGRLDPARLEAAELPTKAPDPVDWVGVIGSWLGPPDSAFPVVVGESGDGVLVGAVRAAGHRVLAVEPRGESAWASLTVPAAGGGPPAEVVLGEVLDHLGTIPDHSCAGVVLAGCVDRVELSAKVGLLGEALRVTRAGDPVVILTVDQSAWDEGLSPPARDLAPGRPLHPETWSLLLRRSGAVGAAWHRAASGTVHAVVARAGP